MSKKQCICIQQGITLRLTMSTVTVIIILLQGLVLLTAADPSTLIPPPQQSGPPAALIFVPGASIGASSYIPLATAIQRDSPYSLWLYTVGDWMGNLVNPLQLPGYIDEAISQLRSKGFPMTSPIFLAAHSLGGVFTEAYVRGSPNVTSGLILYGSYISNSVKFEDYPVPVLTLAGDQDGLCRSTRIAQDFQRMPHEGDVYRTPVVIVQGVNHSEIASGAMPSHVQKYDIVADLSYDEAHIVIANITNSFLALHGPIASADVLTDARNVLNKQLVFTESLVAPFLESVSADHGSYPWAATLQINVSGISPASNIQLGIEITEHDFLTFEGTFPSIGSISNSSVSVRIPYYNSMPFNPLDISENQQTPVYVAVKALNWPTLRDKFGSRIAETNISCYQINRMAYNKALSMTPAYMMERFHKRGRYLGFLPDNVHYTGLDWSLAQPQWRIYDAMATVASPTISTNLERACKLLSLSRMVEWIYVDAFLPRT